MLQVLGCCGSRNPAPKSQIPEIEPRQKHGAIHQVHALPDVVRFFESSPVSLSRPDLFQRQVKEDTALVSWRMKSDDTHTALFHPQSGVVIELLHACSKGWFHCRTANWQMHTGAPGNC